MSRKKWCYLALVILAGGGFIVDRVFIGSPKPAAAEPTSPAPDKKPRRAEPKPAAKADQDQEVDPSLAWLNKLPDSRSPRNAFMPSMVMLKHYMTLQETAREEAEKSKGPEPGSPEAFAAQHALQATFVSKDTLIAVVNGKLLRPGETISEFRLTKIEPYGAEFRRGRDRVTLSIPTPAAPQ